MKHSLIAAAVLVLATSGSAYAENSASEDRRNAAQMAELIDAESATTLSTKAHEGGYAEDNLGFYFVLLYLVLPTVLAF